MNCYISPVRSCDPHRARSRNKASIARAPSAGTEEQRPNRPTPEVWRRCFLGDRRMTERASILIPSITPSRRDRIFARAPRGAVSAYARGSTIELQIFGEIGADGVTPEALAAHLKGAGDVLLKIHSPGGNAFDGVAMHNALVAHPGKVRVEILALAASAASIIAMAGDEIAIAPNAHLMIHRAWGATIGNTQDHQQQADVLAKVDDALAATYARRSNQPTAQVLQWMAGETWMAGPEAIERGFATELLSEGSAPAARFDLSIYSRVPDTLKGNNSPAIVASRSDLERLLHERAHLSRGAARKIAEGGFAALTNSDDESELTAYNELATLVARTNDQMAKIRK